MNQLTDRERALAVAMVGWLLTYLSGPEDHQRMTSVFGFVLAFCFKAHLEDHLSEDQIETLWQGAAHSVRTEDWLLMLQKIGPDMLQLEMKFGQAIGAAKQQKRAHWVKEPGRN
jgi:hypothetical protein